MRVLFSTLLVASVSSAAEFKIGLHTFTLPEGLTVELAAGPPLVDRPITMAFGDTGELYVADSSGSNDPVEKQLAEKPFSYLATSDAQIELVMGDGRLSLEREPPQDFDFLIMDAFSSDAVPAHLLKDRS